MGHGGYGRDNHVQRSSGGRFPHSPNAENHHSRRNGGFRQFRCRSLELRPSRYRRERQRNPLDGRRQHVGSRHHLQSHPWEMVPIPQPERSAMELRHRPAVARDRPDPATSPAPDAIPPEATTGSPLARATVWTSCNMPVSPWIWPPASTPCATSRVAPAASAWRAALGVPT